MLNDLKDVLARARLTAIEDGAGVVALFVILFAGLHLSGSA
jgi:hypothetical protein